MFKSDHGEPIDRQVTENRKPLVTHPPYFRRFYTPLVTMSQTSPPTAAAAVPGAGVERALHEPAPARAGKKPVKEIAQILKKATFGLGRDLGAIVFTQKEIEAVEKFRLSRG